MFLNQFFMISTQMKIKLRDLSSDKINEMNFKNASNKTPEHRSHKTTKRQALSAYGVGGSQNSSDYTSH